MNEPSVKSEPLTYRHDTEHSYFTDLIRAARGDNAARGRLERHRREMEIEIPAREERALKAAERRYEELDLEFRVAPNRTQGQGGYFSPPLWLIDRFATFPSPRRVLAGLIPNLPLPEGVQSLSLPRLTTGTQTGVEADSTTTAKRDTTASPFSSPVATIAGHADVALQLLEQSPRGAAFDIATYKDLRESYDGTLEAQLISGAGTGNGAGAELPGILNLPTGAGGVNAVTYTAASPSGPAALPYVGQMAAQIGNNRLAPPEAWLMRTARWAWLATAEDTATRPIVPPSSIAVPPPRTPADEPDPVSVLLGWPLYCDDAIPPNLGAGDDEDVIIGARPSDHLVLESPERIIVDAEALSGILGVRLTLRRYAAHLARYPQGIAVLGGTGMAVQTGF